MDPKHYFSQGFFSGDEINPELLGKYAHYSANTLMKFCIPSTILDAVYYSLYETFSQERGARNIEDTSDIMRAMIFCEPFVHYNVLIELIDEGLLAAENEEDIEAFFIHFRKVIDLCKYGNMEGVIEY